MVKFTVVVAILITVIEDTWGSAGPLFSGLVT